MRALSDVVSAHALFRGLLVLGRAHDVLALRKWATGFVRLHKLILQDTSVLLSKIVEV